MAFTVYRFVLLKTDPANVRRCEQVGELTHATGRSFQMKLNGIDTASVTVSLTDPIARELVQPTNPDVEFRLKIFLQSDDSLYPTLVFYGPVIDVETVFGSTSGSVQINAASPLWNLTHRFVYKDTINGYAVEHPISDSTRGRVAWEAIRHVENTTGFMGFTLGGGFPQSGSIGAGKPFDAGWRNAAELLTEMGSGSTGDGFDFYIDYGEWPGVPESSLNFGSMGVLFLTERRGSLKPNVIFETGLGTTNTAVQARQSITRSSLANSVYHLPGVYTQDQINNDPTGDEIAVVSASNGPSITARGVHEAILRDDIEDISDAQNRTDFRSQLVDLHVSVRQRPRRIITFEPAPEEQGPNIPRAFVDYGIGDTIQLRAVAPNGQIALNEQLRIYGIDSEIDDQSGTARHTLTLTPED